MGYVLFSFSRLPWQHWFVQMVQVSSLLCAIMLYLIKSKVTIPGRAMETRCSWGNATSLLSRPCESDVLTASSAALQPPSHFMRPHAKHSWWPDCRCLPRSAFGARGYRRAEGLQWFAAQMWKNTHLYVVCQGRDPKPQSLN